MTDPGIKEAMVALAKQFDDLEERMLGTIGALRDDRLRQIDAARRLEGAKLVLTIIEVPLSEQANAMGKNDGERKTILIKLRHDIPEYNDAYSAVVAAQEAYDVCAVNIKEKEEAFVVLKELARFQTASISYMASLMK